MGVTIHVNGTSNSLVHKGSTGIAKSTLPDVCKTPSPGGPIPIPYPIIVSMSSDLKKGSKKVKVDGGNSAAIKGSEFSRCSGDEPGTPGGIKSSTNMKEATWILYSFDVKIEGKNACRLSDKMMMNHGNSACLGGTINPPVSIEDFEEILKECVNKADKQVNKQKFGANKPPPKGWKKYCSNKKRALELGEEKHKVAEKCVTDNMKSKGHQDECSVEQNFIVENGKTKTSPNMVAGCIRPDVVLHEAGKPVVARAVYDFKFSCIPGGPSSWRKASRVTNAGIENNVLYHAFLKVAPKIVRPGRILQIIL